MAATTEVVKHPLNLTAGNVNVHVHTQNVKMAKYWITLTVNAFVLHKDVHQINGLIHGLASVSAMKKDASLQKYLIKIPVLANAPQASVLQEST